MGVFDIGLFEFVTIAVVALLVFGPDRLPKVTAQATHWLRQIREQAQAARQSITDSVDIDTTMLKDISDLHPRNIARSVMEPVAEAKAPIDDAVAAARSTPQPGAASPAAGRPAPAPAADTPGLPPASPAPAPFDPDAT